MTTLVLVLALSLLIGASLGLLGGGGSILTVPILVYVAGLPAKEAIAASLFVVGVTSLAGVVSHARGGRVQWRTGLLFGLAAMAGAFTGGLLGGHVPGDWLLIAFALMMVATSLAMLRGRKDRGPGGHAHRDGGLPLARILIDGSVVGLVTGLVGAGGGFLVVPALVLLGGLPMSVAVGTSLIVIAMKSFAGLAGYLTSVTLDWPLVLGVTGAAVVGSLVGGRLAGRVPEAALRQGFGWFVLVMGGFVLVQQGPSWALPVVGSAVLVLGLAAGACLSFVRACPLRRIITA
ncbi:MAG TPA: sulfite exporter TauE/SafE family protein [Nocardioides sp.]|nr:sulfite exporter TauE/SafE family protein [Nocardioides sp.]